MSQTQKVKQRQPLVTVATNGKLLHCPFVGRGWGRVFKDAFKQAKFSSYELWHFAQPTRCSQLSASLKVTTEG